MGLAPMRHGAPHGHNATLSGAGTAEAMWAANKLDIEATLRHVCRKLLNDEQVGSLLEMRKRRAGRTGTQRQC